MKMGEGLGARWAALQPALAMLRLAGLRAGLAGWVGLGVLAVAAVLGVVGDAWIATQQEALQQQRARLQRSAAPQRAEPAPRARLEAYYTERFPPASALSERLSRIYAMAVQHGVEVRRADYRSVAERATPLQRVALVVPVQGDFPSIYRWLGAVLIDLPELGLESISIKRGGSEARVVEAELRLVMFLREGA